MAYCLLYTAKYHRHFHLCQNWREHCAHPFKTEQHESFHQVSFLIAFTKFRFPFTWWAKKSNIFLREFVFNWPTINLFKFLMKRDFKFILIIWTTTSVSACDLSLSSKLGLWNLKKHPLIFYQLPKVKCSLPRFSDWCFHVPRKTTFCYTSWKALCLPPSLCYYSCRCEVLCWIY